MNSKTTLNYYSHPSIFPYYAMATVGFSVAIVLGLAAYTVLVGNSIYKSLLAGALVAVPLGVWAFSECILRLHRDANIMAWIAEEHFEAFPIDRDGNRVTVDRTKEHRRIERLSGLMTIFIGVFIASVLLSRRFMF